MRLLSATMILLAVACSSHPCSIFKYSVDGRTYFCGNEDWTAQDPAMQTFKAKGGDYGYVLFGWQRFLPRYVQAGVDGKGLCFDWAAVPPQPFVRDDSKRDLGFDFAVEMLQKCANVDEALAFVRRSNVPHFAEEHLMLADSSEKSCVLEYNNSRLHVLVDASEAQFVTNFHLTDHSLGWYPCDRFSRMETFFRQAGNKQARLVELLERVHQEGRYPTIYSYVFDLNRRLVTVFFNHNYQRKSVFLLDRLLDADRVIPIVF